MSADTVDAGGDWIGSTQRIGQDAVAATAAETAGGCVAEFANAGREQGGPCENGVQPFDRPGGVG